MRLGRRGFLGLGAAAAVAAGLAFTERDALVSSPEAGRLLRSRRPLPAPYQVPLPIPPVLRPVRTDATTDYYEIVQAETPLRILLDAVTPAWTYGGAFPGPTIVSASGRRTVVRHRNELPRPVVVHLHGGHTPHDSDGYPGDEIRPAGASPPAMPAGMTVMPGVPVTGSRSYTYPLDQRAATLWYHDHRTGFTGPALWRGLAGFHILHDDEERGLPLPDGERDLPLMITDRSFAADGGFAYPSLDQRLLTLPGVTAGYLNGVLGDVILVNGAPWPVHQVDRLRYRLRLLNASNARRYRFALDPPPPGGGGLVQIGGDGGLLAAPLVHDSIDAAPGERFDVVVDFARYGPGARVRLVNLLGSGGTREVVRFDLTSRSVKDESAIPARLSRVEALDPAKAAVTRSFLFQKSDDGWTINGQKYDPERPLAMPRLGQIERWRFVTDFHHPIHIHLAHFQILARNGEAPSRYDHGWKDTIDLRPAESAEIVTRFTGYPGRYVFHCHNLEHEDMAMMADFITH